MTERYYFTRSGLRRFHARLEDARAAYKVVCDDNPEARESGDSSVWHDNFAFEENQRQMHQLARRVRDMERVLDQAELVPPLREPPPRIVLGARVRYAVEDDERICEIASFGDGDPSVGRVSYDSPLGRALVGLRVGDEVELTIAGRTRWVEVLEIAAPSESDDVEVIR
ncbi:MAG: GreA/GreB family elongation factor [Myxococcales bacterium]|nr:GreA/GreB family elongation factor [Myxococcales bacterium]